jgi:hypothetical protein
VKKKDKKVLICYSIKIKQKKENYETLRQKHGQFAMQTYGSRDFKKS